MWRVRYAVHTPGRLQQIAINCKRSDYNKKKLAKCHFWAAFWRNRTTVPPSYDAALPRAQRCLTLMNFMSSTRNRSTATMMCWMKKTTNAISDTSKKESVQIALLQTHHEDGAILSILRRSLIGISSVHCVQMCWKRSTNFFISQKLVGRHARVIWMQIFYKFDQFWVASHEILNLAGSDHEFLEKCVWCLSFLNYGQWSVVFVLQSSHDDCHEVVLS